MANTALLHKHEKIPGLPGKALREEARPRKARVSRETYVRLFLSTLKLSACTFGGGFVIIPLMRQRFVEELHWIDEREMLDLASIAQSAPGAIAVNASILVGYRVAGVAGALLTMLGTILPPLVIISVISFFYAAFRDNIWVSRVMSGMLAGVAAVIFDVVINLGSGIVKSKKLLSVAILLASFAAVRFLGISSILVILVCASLGAADVLLRQRRSGK